MRHLLIGTAIVLAAVAALFALWIFGGRHLVLLIDQFRTNPLGSQAIDHIDYDGNETSGKFGLGGSSFDTQDCSFRPFSLTLRPNEQNEFVVTASGKSFILGPISTQTIPPRILPAARDKVSFETRRSIFSWPTPFDVNYMTGHSPSWRRNIYYLVHWQKASGQKLEMVWRYEQYFYPADGWTSPFMTREGATGLVRVKIK
jgi:hypothetical protein